MRLPVDAGSGAFDGERVASRALKAWDEFDSANDGVDWLDSRFQLFAEAERIEAAAETLTDQEAVRVLLGTVKRMRRWANLEPKL